MGKVLERMSGARSPASAPVVEERRKFGTADGRPGMKPAARLELEGSCPPPKREVRQR
jgi:hypothetical protein